MPERAPADHADSTDAGAATATVPCDDGEPDPDASSCSDALLDDDATPRSWGAPAAADDDVDDDDEFGPDEFDDEGFDEDGFSRFCMCGCCDRCRDMDGDM